jgi:hypothetical protein
MLESLPCGIEDWLASLRRCARNDDIRFDPSDLMPLVLHDGALRWSGRARR